ncbi:MAG TPA: PD-(D/E)XK nuclease family protein [Steroidobacteraceae bacterium]|nr:PD-(D/E)XK nuclease family protein [Steroidobacteraceae bacterium]
MFRLPTDLSAHLEGGQTLLVPTRQRVRAVQLAYAAARLAAGARVWASPDVLTPAAWARRELAALASRAGADWPRLLPATEEWFLWRQAASAAAGELGVLDPGALADSLQQASELAADYHIEPVRAPADTEAGVLHAAQRHFHSRCQELKATGVTGLAARLSAAPRARALRLAGFDAVPPRLAALVPGGAAGPGAPAALRTLRSADAAAEMEAITAWCRERLLAQRDARLLVMRPGPAGARERLASLIAGALDPALALDEVAGGRTPVGIEGGERFATLPLPAQALTVLALLGGETLEFESLSAALTAPYWSRPAPTQRAALALMLRQRALPALDLRQLRGALQLAPPELKPASRELDVLLRDGARHLGEGAASARRWAERFEAALGAAGWPGPLPPVSGVQQTRLRWRELLEELGELGPGVGQPGRAAALELLRSLARHTNYRPADDDVAVMITPALLDPVVRYDGIWVAGLSADVLPQPLAPNPFLALSAQRAAGVPAASSAGRRAQAEALLRAWRHGADELVLSVPARERDLELLPSVLLGAVPREEAAPESLWLAQRLARARRTEQLVDERGTSWNPLRPIPGTRALTLQSACGFRAFAELQLGAPAPERAEPGIPADQRGILLHAALQGLWERLRDSVRLAALDAAGLDALIAECVAQAARTLQLEVRGRRRSRRRPDGQFELFAALSPALTRECRRAEALIRRLCELERTRAPFTVVGTEQPAELQLAGGRIPLRLDRIDAVAGGRLVLDYKSGRAGSPDWYGERPTHPQLIAYLTALGADVIGLATVNLTAREVRFTGVAAAGGILPQVRALPAGSGDWPTQQRAWRERLETLVRAFLSGEARVEPAPGACEYCHVKPVCRIGAHRIPEDDPVEERDE